jgi:hypothetical protein
MRMKKIIGGLICFILCFMTNCSLKSDSSSLRIVAENVTVNQKWLEITLTEPLVAKDKLYILGLELKNVKNLLDNNSSTLKLIDGTNLQLEVELVNSKNETTKLYPTGITGFVEFGKKTFDQSKIEDAYFKPGEEFSKIRIRCDKEISLDKIIWTKFDF